ncbi:MAG TPA: HflC protein [Gammaproteobacteria bacterium]|nr:HflC protein [Gammaproteobacteria bacterium]
MPVKSILGGIVVLIGLLMFYAGFVVVNPGHVGVIKRLGAVSMTPLPEGFHLKIPFIDIVEEIDIRLQPARVPGSAASKDLQQVDTTIVLQYSLNAALVPRTFQQVGNRAIVKSAILTPAIAESVKAITAQFTAEELVTRRAEVTISMQAQIENFLTETLTQKDLNGSISIANLAIEEFEFSADFNRSIEEKVRAEQDALKAENEKIKKITQAEASAAERTLSADAEAYKTEVESIARAEAIRREAAALKNNPELIQLRMAEKWDGKLPQFTGGAIPFLQVENLLKDSN